MKKKRNGRSSLRLRFILICMSQLVLVAALSELAGWAFRHWFGVTPELPIFVWAMVFSGTIGVAVTNHMTKMLIDPIAKLRSAMREVADGDFKVEAKCESRIQDVQDIYDSFNSMVRELSTTETLQTDFISDVAHEFKPPINAIEGYASLLEGEPSPEEQRAYVEKILFNTRRLSALTGNILLLSKLSNQSILPQCVQVVMYGRRGLQPDGGTDLTHGGRISVFCCEFCEEAKNLFPFAACSAHLDSPFNLSIYTITQTGSKCKRLFKIYKPSRLNSGM